MAGTLALVLVIAVIAVMFINKTCRERWEGSVEAELTALKRDIRKVWGRKEWRGQ